MEEGYSLDRYFRVKAEVKMPDGSVAYIRSLSDDEMSVRRKAATVASRNRRMSLRDESSSAFLDFVQPVENAPDDELVETIVALSQQEFQQQAADRFPRRHIPYPDDADLEEQHEVDSKREEHWEEIFKARMDYVKERSESYREQVQNWTREQRVTKCKDLVAANHSLVAFLEEQADQLIFLGCFSDEKRKKRYFTSVEDVRQLHPGVKRRLASEIQRINELDVFELEGFSSTASS